MADAPKPKPDQPKPAEQLTGRASILAGTHVPGEGYQATPAQKAAAGPQPEPKTVTMDVLRDGSFQGEYYHVGDTVDVPEAHLEALTLSGFAARSDRAALAQQARDDAAKDKADADQKAADKAAARNRTGRSTAVAPLGTRDLPGAELVTHDEIHGTEPPKP